MMAWQATLLLLALSLLTCFAEGQEVTTVVSTDENEATTAVNMDDDIASNEDDIQSEEDDTATDDDDIGYKDTLTPLGNARGRVIVSPRTGRTYYAYRGVPYARPPVGELRFKPPMAADAWGYLRAYDFDNDCAQYDAYGVEGEVGFSGNEDCLYLNIYSPKVPEFKDKAKCQDCKPVMVYIHGGGFTTGSGQTWNPDELVTQHDIVVVTVNYRLGVLGFLTFDNDLAPGNLGLRDQIMALRFVQRYIGHFGGDPDRVTIAGLSAGAASVHALVMSPQTDGLFHAAIAMSGSMLTAAERDKTHGHVAAKRIANFFGCNRGTAESKSQAKDDKAMLDCLQMVSAEDLVSLSRTQTDTNMTEKFDNDNSLSWGPTVDTFSASPVLPLDPLAAMKLGAFHKVPMLVGTAKYEGLEVTHYFTDFDSVDGVSLATLLGLTASSNKSEVTSNEVERASTAMKFYVGNSTATAKEDWVDMFTDALFLSPTMKLVELTATQQPEIYVYQLTQQSNVTYGAELNDPNAKRFSPTHGDDILYLFDGNVGFTKDYVLENEDDLQLRQQIQAYFANFVKYGKPNDPEKSDNLTHWLTFQDAKNYMELKKDPQMLRNINPDRMEFWDTLLWNQKEMEVDQHEDLLQDLKQIYAADFQ